MCRNSLHHDADVIREVKALDGVDGFMSRELLESSIRGLLDRLRENRLC
jgi:predicted transcriptional regulator of viral defense system